MRALVYCANVDDAARPASTFNAPQAINLRPVDHELGIAFRACQDCGGTGRFPVPWEVGGPDDAPYLLDGKLVPSDFCVACKGRGLEPVMA